MYARLVNRILIGLVLLVSGLLKLFVFGVDGVTNMLAGLGFPIAAFLAWVLILAEIIFGLAIIINYKLEYTVWPGVVIMVVAAFTAHLYGDPTNGPNWTNILIHLALASNLWLIAHEKPRRNMSMQMPTSTPSRKKKRR